MNFQLLMSTEAQYASYEIALIAYRALIRDHFNFFTIRKENIFLANLRDE